MKRNNKVSQRITLSEVSKKKVEEWKFQIESELYGSSIQSSLFVNAILELMDEKLPRELFSRLKSKFFDPIGAMEWAAKNAKEKMREGEDINFEDIITMLSREGSKRVKKSPPKLTPPKGTNNSAKKEKHLTSTTPN